MAQEDINNINDGEEKEIDLLELASTLWKQRRKLILWSFCGAIIGLIIAFSIPREYSTSVKLAPEINDTKTPGGGLGALASMAGLSTGASVGTDAVYPMLYPDVVSSVPFLTGLFDVEVPLKEDGRKMTVQEYMQEETTGPWWGVIMGLPGKIIGLFKSEEEVPGDHKLNNFQLTMDESKLVESLSKRVTASVDAKTSVVTIDVLMQDPLVSAVLADTVVSRLQEYITAYRTNKARKDLAYAEKLNQEAKTNYYEAQQKFADYLDRNQGIAFRSAQTIRDRLENEAALAFNLYNQTAAQVQKAQAKVQETTPVYAVITPPTVPIKPASPRKVLILIGFTFLAFAACAAWILFVQPFMQQNKQKFATEGAKDEGKHGKHSKKGKESKEDENILEDKSSKD